MPKVPGTRLKAFKPKRYPGVRRQARHLRYNLTSTKGKTPAGETIGTRPPKVEQEGPSIEASQWGALAGYAGGVSAGSGVGYLAGRKRHPESKKFKQELSKARFIRITEVGTAAAKGPKMKRWPKFPGKAMGIGAGVGGGIGYGASVSQAKGKAAYVKEQERKRLVTKKYEQVKPDWDRKKRHGFESKGSLTRWQQETKHNVSYRGPHGKENRKISRNATAAGAAVGTAAGAGLSAHAIGREYKSVKAQTAPVYHRQLKGKYGAAAGMVTGGSALIGTAYGHAVGQARRQSRGQIRAANAAHKRGELRQPKKGEKIGVSGVIKMDTTSAFGVDHAIEKKAAIDPDTGKKPSAGRRVLASAPYAGAVHPFVAGKKGKKWRSAGNQIGGALAGNVAGGAAGLALTRGRSLGTASVLGTAGAIGGGQMGLNRNQRKGYLKPQS